MPKINFDGTNLDSTTIVNTGDCFFINTDGISKAAMLISVSGCKMLIDLSDGRCIGEVANINGISVQHVKEMFDGSTVVYAPSDKIELHFKINHQ